MKNIAILLTCHNRKDKTLACLSSLYTCIVPEGYSFEVFLVDDGSTDGTSEAVREQFPLVNVIIGEGTLFWNRGMNRAWSEAAKKDFDYYLWLNDDTILHAYALSVLLHTSEQLQHRVIVVGSTCAVNDTTIVTYGGRTSAGQVIQPTNETQTCNYFNGNIVLFPKYVYEKVGMNDPVFRHALGDFDYGLRAVKACIQLIVAPNILGKCDTNVGFSTWCNPKQPFKIRWKAFRTPIGQNPEEFFVFEMRHGGLGKALFHYMTNHLRVVCPRLWGK